MSKTTTPTGAGRKRTIKVGQLRKVRRYTLIYLPDHPRAQKGYVPEHRAIAERALGKILSASAVVHHVNNDGHDNRPSNLVVCQDHAYHFLLHARQRALEACGNPNWLICVYCRTYDDPSAMYVYNGGRAGRHRECANAYDRERRRSR